MGFRRPVILLPTEMATADGLTSIEPLIMHEYAQRATERLFWFNPLVWFIGRRIALEREVAADEAVVARTRDPMPQSVTIATPVALPSEARKAIAAATSALDASDMGQKIQAEVQRSLGDVTKRHLVALSDSDGPVSRDMVRSCIGCDFSRRDLRSMDLSNLSLIGDDFSRSDLRGVNFHASKLTGVDLSHSDLDGADLSNASLRGVDRSHESFRFFTLNN